MEVNRIEINNSEALFKQTAQFLRKFAVFLSVTKRDDHKLVMKQNLVYIVADFPNPHEYVSFNTKEVLQKFRRELASITPDHPVNEDMNNIILQLFANCLLHITNLLQEEGMNPKEVFQNFVLLRKCFLVFGMSKIVLDTSCFKNAISCWIGDLLKIITEADAVARGCPKHLMMFNVIKEILKSLARCYTYFTVILREIIKKFQCALTYYAANEQFASFISSKTTTLEYLLWIMKCAVTEAVGRGHRLEDVCNMRDRYMLETLAKCLEGNSPTIIQGILSDILRYY